MKSDDGDEGSGSDRTAAVGFAAAVPRNCAAMALFARHTVHFPEQRTKHNRTTQPSLDNWWKFCD